MEVNVSVPIHATVPSGGREFCARSVSIVSHPIAKIAKSFWGNHHSPDSHLHTCCVLSVALLYLASQLSVSRSVSTAAAVCDQMFAPAAADSLGRFAQDG